MNNKFTYNDWVRISETVSENLNPGAEGAVCGFFVIESEELAKEYHSSVGNILYLIELENGNSHSIPEEFLEKIE